MLLISNFIINCYYQRLFIVTLASANVNFSVEPLERFAIFFFRIMSNEII